MDLDPSILLDLGAFGLLAVLVMRWFGKLEGAMDRLTAAITNQNDGQHHIVRVLTLLAAALREPQGDREAMLAEALEILERRKETHR